MPEIGVPGVARRRVDDVVGADDEHDVGGRRTRGLTSSISLSCSYGTFASASSTFMWPGIRPATGWMPYEHLDAALAEQVDELVAPCAAPARRRGRSRAR